MEMNGRDWLPLGEDYDVDIFENFMTWPAPWPIDYFGKCVFLLLSDVWFVCCLWLQDCNLHTAAGLHSVFKYNSNKTTLSLMYVCL